MKLPFIVCIIAYKRINIIMNSACVPESTRSLCCTFQMFHIKKDVDDSFVHDKMQIINSRFSNCTEFIYLINMSNNI